VNVHSEVRPRTNWAGNIAFAAPDFYRPATGSELQSVVARARQVRVLATGHSFNDMADSPGAQVSLAGLPPEVELDSAGAQVRVAAGLSYARLASQLDRYGFALRNLASLPHISVAGACATGTHGSGPANQNLAAAVAGLELVTADGDVVELGREDADFPGAVVHLGALGAVTRLILDVVPSFQVSQRVYEGLPLDVLDDHFAAIMASGYSASMFTDWRAPRLTQLWIKSLSDAARSPSAPSITEAPWFTARPALQELARIAGRVAPVLRICEIRRIAADDLWLSPCYRQDSVAFHFTWIRDPAAVLPVAALIEQRLAPFAPRPHWGKIFTTPASELADRYDRLPDFLALARHYDPAGKFRNAYTARYLGR